MVSHNILLKYFTALAFVPEYSVLEYFKILCNSVHDDAPAEVFAFIDYITKT